MRTLANYQVGIVYDGKCYMEIHNNKYKDLHRNATGGQNTQQNCKCGRTFRHGGRYKHEHTIKH